jgi:hypothetical protein
MIHTLGKFDDLRAQCLPEGHSFVRLRRLAEQKKNLMPTRFVNVWTL